MRFFSFGKAAAVGVSVELVGALVGCAAGGVGLAGWVICGGVVGVQAERINTKLSSKPGSSL